MFSHTHSPSGPIKAHNMPSSAWTGIFPDLNLQDTSLLLRKHERLGKWNHSFWFHSACFHFFLILLSFPGDSNCERQALFTGWSELTPGAIAGALCSWREAGGAEEMLQARLWLSKAHTHTKAEIISCLCSNLTVFSGGKLRIYKWGPNHRKWSSMLYLPQAPSVCVSAWREAPSSSRAQVSPPQQMLQKGDTSRG